jgi:hypothetical protein
MKKSIRQSNLNKFILVITLGLALLAAESVSADPGSENFEGPYATRILNVYYNVGTERHDLTFPNFDALLGSGAAQGIQFIENYLPNTNQTSDFAQIVTDPVNPANHVLWLKALSNGTNKPRNECHYQRPFTSPTQTNGTRYTFAFRFYSAVQLPTNLTIMQGYDVYPGIRIATHPSTPGKIQLLLHQCLGATSDCPNMGINPFTNEVTYAVNVGTANVAGWNTVVLNIVHDNRTNGIGSVDVYLNGIKTNYSGRTTTFTGNSTIPWMKAGPYGKAAEIYYDDVYWQTNFVDPFGPAAPEIDVRGLGLSIADGDATPSTTDDTDFGSADITSGTVNRTFTVWNMGNSSLSVSNVTLSGAHAGDFSVTTQPGASVVPGGTTTFSVRFDPSATGLRTASLSFGNNDASENPYNFSIQGAGTGAPEINVTGLGVSIADGDTTPSSTDDTDFGSADIVGGTATHTFTVQNTGNTSLTVNNVTLSGANAGDFSVTTQPAASVAPGGTTTFSVRFDASAAGVRVASVSFGNNDASENPYNFSIQGTGVDCQTTSTNLWLNASLPAQTATFTATFDATPSINLINAAVGLSSGVASQYTNLACIARFNPSGNIDAINGPTYSAASTIPYSANVSYHFRLVISVATHTYSIYVTPAGGSELTVGLNYAFRSEQSAVTQLNNWAARVNGAGAVQVCNVTATPSTAFVTGVTSFGTINNNFSGWVGFRLDVGAAPLTVKELARWVQSGNSATHTVKLVVVSTGADVVGGSVSVATSGAPAGQFKYVSLAAPVTLAANTSYYLVTQETSGGDAWYDRDNTALTHTAVGTIPNPAFLNGSTWSNNGLADHGFGPVNFKY